MLSKAMLFIRVALMGSLMVGILYFALPLVRPKPLPKEEDRFQLFYHEIGAPAEQNRPPEVPLDAPFSVEVLVTEDQIQAQEVTKSLVEKGLDAYFIPLRQNHKVLYRVRSGYFSRRDT